MKFFAASRIRPRAIVRCGIWIGTFRAAIVTATTNRDIPVIQGIALYLTVIVVVVNLLVDLAYGWLNPKARVR